MSANKNNKNRITIAETLGSSWRIAQDASDQLAVGPGYALLSGCVSIFGIASFEGWACLRPFQAWDRSRMWFVTRYGLYQIVPSVTWSTQPPHVVASHLGLPTDMLYPSQSRPSSRIIMLTRLRAIRGAIAGSVLLSQVVSFTQVASQAKAQYAKRIALGRESPLVDNTQKGVVIRLAGRDSDTTALSMKRRGRRSLFPIFEDSRRVQSLVQQYSQKRIPIYWQVNDGRYSYANSWEGLHIPNSWPFSTNQGSLLILEGDATCSDTVSLRKTNPMMDLDMYEASQGFHQLQLLAKADRVLRVLLVDCEVTVKSGGGHESSIRSYIEELGLADVIVDARRPLLRAMQTWLDSVAQGRKVVILETPNSEWYQSIQRELRKLGYTVMDRIDAQEQLGENDAAHLPMLVYQTTSADTVHTIRQLLNRGLVKPENVCALLTHHEGLVELKGVNLPGVHNICSSALYDDLLQNVRDQALEGRSWEEIQEELDRELE